MRVSAWGGLLVALGLAPAGVARAQGVSSEIRCYQFDQPYFVHVRAAAGHPVATPDTSAFDRLRAPVRAARRDQGEKPDPYLHYLVDSVRLDRTALVRLERVPADTLGPGGGRRVGLMPAVTLQPGRDGRLERVAEAAPTDMARSLTPVFTLPEVTRLDSEERRMYRRWGHWQPFSDGSVEISWYDGFHGPLFRLAVRGDSLVGTVVHRTDVIRRDSVTGHVVRPVHTSAHAVRVACPPPRGPA